MIEFLKYILDLLEIIKDWRVVYISFMVFKGLRNRRLKISNVIVEVEEVLIYMCK